MKINRNFDDLVPNYLFADVARKTNEFAAAHPEREIIKLGIGDVTLPLAPIVVAAMRKGCEDLRYKETFKGSSRATPNTRATTLCARLSRATTKASA